MNSIRRLLFVCRPVTGVLLPCESIGAVSHFYCSTLCSVDSSLPTSCTVMAVTIKWNREQQFWCPKSADMSAMSRRILFISQNFSRRVILGPFVTVLTLITWPDTMVLLLLYSLDHLSGTHDIWKGVHSWRRHVRMWRHEATEKRNMYIDTSLIP